MFTPRFSDCEPGYPRRTWFDAPLPPDRSRRTLSIFYGVFFGAVMVVIDFTDHDDRSAIGRIGGAAVGDVVGGVVFGAVMGWQVSLRHEQARVAAERLLQFQLAEYDRRRETDLPFLILVPVGLVLAAIFVSTWWALGALGFAYVLGVYLTARRRLTKRLRLVRTGATGIA